MCDDEETAALVIDNGSGMCKVGTVNHGFKSNGNGPSFIWKKVEEYLRLFETYGGILFSLFLLGRLRKLACFSGRIILRMKLIAKKELIFLFLMPPSRIL